METQLDIFKDTAEILNKEVLKQRVQATNFHDTHPEFSVSEWGSEDDDLIISYQVGDTPFGQVLLAATEKGVVYTGFSKSSRVSALDDLEKRFPGNRIVNQDSPIIQQAFNRLNEPASIAVIPLHLKGSAYQMAIWEKLLLIPFGGLVNYKRLGNGEPDARDIGAAVGANPVCVLVPCHRVIKADGTFNGYFWGNKKKAEILTYEARTNEKPNGN